MKQRIMRTIVATCAFCGSKIEFREQPDLGDISICPDCRTYLEVVELSPLRLGWLFDKEDDPSKFRAR